MPETTAAPKDRLQKLRDSFAAQLPGKIKQIREAWEKVSGLESSSGETRQFALMLHTMAGSAPSFGFKEIGIIVREMEKLVKSVNEGAKPSQEIQGRMAAHLEELAASTGIQAAIESVKVDAPIISDKAEQAENSNRLVFVAGSDNVLAEHLATQISHFGYEARPFTDLASMKTAIAKTAPAAIVSDISFPEGELAAAEAIILMRQNGSMETPAIFMSQRNHLDARLKAAQAGGEAYFLRPVQLCDLLAKLDALVFKTAQAPYRVLIVDDDAELSELHSAILQEFGIVTRVITDPMQILKHLVGFRPDLVLLDMYMPGCNGHDLARAIRQIEDYDGIPIVFLSAETSVDKQLEAIRMGGDDFLVKPVRPEFLLSSVNIWAKRMRAVRNSLEFDSLTGLLNMTKTQEQLEAVLARAKKSNSVCSFAVIEIDDLQEVNNRHGYLTGDRIIQLTALLLKRRIRNSDIAGRCGGAKYSVILPETKAEAAFAALDEVRQSFARILHECHHGEFYLTLSGGIAVYPLENDAAELYGAALKALESAQKNGKNRIQIAGR